MKASKGIVPIFFACDDKYVKFTMVTLKSIMENASKDYYALSVLLQETGKTVPSEEELCETCSHCGFH